MYPTPLRDVTFRVFFAMQDRDLRCLEDLEEREERRGVQRHDGLTNKVPTRFIGTPGDSRPLDFLRITGRMTTGTPKGVWKRLLG
jgi:hypothetical protein